MKRLAIGLLAIIPAGMLALCFPIYAQPAQTPHINPTAAKDTLEATEMLSSYSNLFNLAALRQYHGAQSMLTEIRTIEIPDELQYIIDRYNNLSRELFTTMNSAEYLLNEASALFSEDQNKNAQEKLDEAGAAIQKAQFLLIDIEAMTDTLVNKLGVLAAPSTSRFKQAIDRLMASLKLLQKLTIEIDRLRQQLSENPVMSIKPRFYYPTLLDVSAPATIHPGLPFTVSGKVQSNSSSIARTIKLCLDDTELAEVTVSGSFCLQVATPHETTTGEHILTVAAAPQDHYPAAQKKLTVNVARLPIQADIQLPGLAILPRPIQISGVVRHELSPLPDARVYLSFKDSVSITGTGADGRFTAAIDTSQLTVKTATSANPFYATSTARELPFDFSLLGWQEVMVKIEPAEPWHSTLETKRVVFTINPLNTTLLLAALASLGLFLYRRSSAQLQKQKSYRSQQAGLNTFMPAAKRKPGLAGIEARILSSYQSGLMAAEKASGISMLTHTTFREFLQAASSRLASAAQPFSELTTLAEMTLYSPQQPDEVTASRAEQLAASINQELQNGTP